MSSFDRQWQKLTALARTAPAAPEAAAPYGFATRLAAQAAALPAATPWLSLERIALRGLVVAAALSVAAVVLNYANLLSEQSDALANSDTVTEMLDLS
jgi:hypothetical protein